MEDEDDFGAPMQVGAVGFNPFEQEAPASRPIGFLAPSEVDDNLRRALAAVRRHSFTMISPWPGDKVGHGKPKRAR